MLTAAQLAEMEERAEAATPRPWTRQAGQRRAFVGALDEFDTPRRVIEASVYPGQEGMVFCSVADSAFITASRDDVPALLAEVRRLQAAALTPQEARTLRATYLGERFSTADLNAVDKKLSAIADQEDP